MKKQALSQMTTVEEVLETVAEFDREAQPLGVERLQAEGLQRLVPCEPRPP